MIPFNGRIPIIKILSPSRIKGRFGGGGIFFWISLFFIFLFLTACREESADGLPAPVKNTRILEFNERILLRAIASTLKERGFEDPKVDADQGKVETDYFIQEKFRTRVEATVKKISRKEGEVTLSVITEQKSSGEWKPVKILGKAQFDKFFEEIEMQAYRELAKGE